MPIAQIPILENMLKILLNSEKQLWLVKNKLKTERRKWCRFLEGKKVLKAKNTIKN